MDENGTLDLEKGTKRPRSTDLKMKYTKEARFATGMCMQLDPDGKIIYDDKGRPLGKTLPIFEYTEKKVVSNKDYVIMFDQTIKEARHKAEKRPWVVDPTKGEGQGVQERLCVHLAWHWGSR